MRANSLVPHKGIASRAARLLGVAAGLLGLCFTLGCGATFYAVQVTSAASRVEEAKTVRAAELAPYEYYFACEHLFQAQVEAAAGNYSDAARYAQQAEDSAGFAIAASTHKGEKEADSEPSTTGNSSGDKSDTKADSTDHETDSSP